MADEATTYLTLSQVAVRTGRHPELLRQWCAAGRIPCVRLGGSWVVREDDLALLDRIATRTRRRTAAPQQKSGRTLHLAAIFEESQRAERAAAALRERLDLASDAVETSPVKLRVLGSSILTVVAATLPAESSLDGRRVLTSYGGRVIAELDGEQEPSAPRRRTGGRRSPAHA